MTRDDTIRLGFLRETSHLLADHYRWPAKHKEKRLSQLRRVVVCPHKNVRGRAIQGGYGTDWKCRDCGEIVWRE